MPLIVKYKDENLTVNSTTVAYVDFGQNAVYFPHHPELNSDEDLKKAVLSTLVAPVVSMPVMPDVSKQMDRMKAAKGFSGQGYTSI